MKKGTELITLKPQNEQLKKLVAYYYFHTSNNEQHSESFYFYPNYLHALTIYQGNNVVINSENKSAKINACENKNKLTVIYTINLKDKCHVEMNGVFNKIGIVFYPLGINHFIDKPLNELSMQQIQEVSLNPSFYEILSQLTDDLSAVQKLEIVENALLSIIQPFQEIELQKAIKEIIKSNGAIKISELEQITSKNRKTLLRLFKKHTLTTIEEYKKMVMFRNSLNYAIKHKELANLTDVALYNMYYDQSHFIKHFKSITKETPKTLLPKIKQIDNEDLYWYFLED